MDLSFQEKSVWASLIAIVAVFGFHFYKVFGPAQAINTADLLVRLVGIVIVIVIIEIVLHIIIAMTAARDAEVGGAMDERDVLVATRAYRNAYMVMFVGVIYMLGYVIAGDLNAGSRWTVNAVNSANLLLLILVVAEIVNYGSRIFYYRSGV
jgi:hypothetical protein